MNTEEILTAAAIALTSGAISALVIHWLTRTREKEKDERSALAQRNTVLRGKLEDLINMVLLVEETLESQAFEIREGALKVRNDRAPSSLASVGMHTLTKALWLQELYFPGLEEGMASVKKGVSDFSNWLESELLMSEQLGQQYQESMKEAQNQQRLDSALKRMWDSNKAFMHSAKREVQKLL